jgi:chaperonin GroEL (HSP60 family)
VTVTNDGATILKLLDVQHPAAKVPAKQSGKEKKKRRSFQY